MKITSLADLTPDPNNANKGTDRGRKIVKESLSKLGAGRSILADKHGTVIAGNTTLSQAKALGLGVDVVKTRGDRLVVVQRDDLDLGDSKARELAYADNRAAQLGIDFDADKIAADFAAGIDLGWLEFEESAKSAIHSSQVGTQDAVQDQDKTPSKTDKKTITCPECGHSWDKYISTRSDRRDGDVKQARARINRDVELGVRRNPADLHCSICGHKGSDRVHEYHHVCGYGPDHHYDVLPMCSKCHHDQHKSS